MISNASGYRTKRFEATDLASYREYIKEHSETKSMIAFFSQNVSRENTDVDDKVFGNSGEYSAVISDYFATNNSVAMYFLDDIHRFITVDTLFASSHQLTQQPGGCRNVLLTLEPDLNHLR